MKLHSTMKSVMFRGADGSAHAD